MTRMMRRILSLVAVVVSFGLPAAAAPPQSSEIPDNTPGFVRKAIDRGPVDPSTVITVTAWLKLHNENQLENLLAQQKQKGSASYHKWITQDEFNARFSPTAQEVKSLQNFLTAHGLSVLATAENNFYVKVQGTVEAIEKAFHVQIDSYDLNGVTYRANNGNPSVNDVIGGHIAAISGMDDFGYQPTVVFPKTADGEQVRPAHFSGVPQTGPNGLFFDDECFNESGAETHTFSQSTPPVTATYSGNRYGAPITNTSIGELAPCGYQPYETFTAYNMWDAFQAGYDGTGETIVIVDAYGSPDVNDEASVFSQVMGLPFNGVTQLRAPGAFHNTDPHFGGGSAGWQAEIALDVEWAHAMAPYANIVLVVGPNNGADLDEAVNYAVVHHLGNTISNSWSSIEGFGNPAQFGRMNRILMSAAAQGIDVNFSSGDFGDFEARVGFKTVGFPTSSPYATGVGGTSLFIDANHAYQFETGWGTNFQRIAGVSPSFGAVLDDNPPTDPPLAFGFQSGAGGGDSLTFAKPSWQSSLPGSVRKVPDIGWLADPQTGAEIVMGSFANGFDIGVIGGTSLACPMFSGIMADAATKNGNVGLGQAAPLLYGLTSGITDVPGSFAAEAGNVTGTIVDSNGTTNYSADDLAAPLDGVTHYVSAIFQSPGSSRYDVFTFGTDTSLQTATGWDNVTGLGTPDGVNFINALVP